MDQHGGRCAGHGATGSPHEDTSLPRWAQPLERVGLSAGVSAHKRLSDFTRPLGRPGREDGTTTAGRAGNGTWRLRQR